MAFISLIFLATIMLMSTSAYNYKGPGDDHRGWRLDDFIPGFLTNAPVTFYIDREKFNTSISYVQKMNYMDRFHIMMRTFYEQNQERIALLNHARYMYEESPQYEAGYIMGEILERYKKVIENIRIAMVHEEDPHPVNYHYYPNHVFGLVVRLERAQRYFFEIYHLVRMLNEVLPKYKNHKEFRNIGVVYTSMTDVMKAEAAATNQQKKVAEQKKQALSEAKQKMREKHRQAKDPNYAEKLVDSMTTMGELHVTPRPERPHLSTIDYGWRDDDLGR